MSPTSVHTTRHHDRVAIVTGAASGIGRATVQRLVAEGASVVACDIDEARLRDAAAANPEGRVLVAAGDIASPDDVHRIVTTTINTFGTVDVLANVAGVMDNMEPLDELDDDTWKRVMRINVDGPMLLSRAVLPHFLAQERGAIVNVGSEASIRGGSAGFAYTTSKHALLGQTRSIACMYAQQGVRCNMVLPGGVATNIAATMTNRSEAGLERLVPVISLCPQIAEPDELAAVIAWIASDEAQIVNGAVLTSDGGWAAA